MDNVQSSQFHFLLLMLLSCHYYITHMWSKFQNWHTIYTGAADHVFAANTSCGMGYFTIGNSKGWFSLKPLFLLAIRCHCLETWALSSGIHLTYMHIIKVGESSINTRQLRSQYGLVTKYKKKKKYIREVLCFLLKTTRMSLITRLY